MRFDGMEKINYVITSEAGLHARPAGILVKEARKYKSSIIVNCGDKSADCKKLFSLMELIVKKGNNITLMIEGSDEQIAAVELAEFLKKNL
jgi:phosphocarrier protein HPr